MASEPFTLSDGRTLDVRITGPSTGLPLLYHHGTPSASSPIRAFERAAHDRGFQFVSISRPGYGGSTPLPGRSVADVVTDMTAALELAGGRQCVVAGWSGGGPHALACAARLPGVVGALVMAGVAPSEAENLDWLAGMGADNVEEFAAARSGEEVLRRYLVEQREGLKDATPADIHTSLESVLPEVDRAVLNEEFGQDLATTFREGLREGVEGWLEDDVAFLSPWGFSLDEIDVPVSIWQGSEDLMVPAGHGEWLSAHVPGARSHLERGQGHLSVILGCVDRMFDELARFAEG
jgi:pimeloyl-ACP methyl ester carboxylesterase